MTTLDTIRQKISQFKFAQSNELFSGMQEIQPEIVTIPKSTPQFLPQGQQDIIGKTIKTVFPYAEKAPLYKAGKEILQGGTLAEAGKKFMEPESFTEEEMKEMAMMSAAGMGSVLENVGGKVASKVISKISPKIAPEVVKILKGGEIQIGSEHIGNIVNVEFKGNKADIGELEIFEEFRNKGFGTKVIDNLFKEHPKIKTITFQTVPESRDFWTKMGAIDEEYYHSLNKKDFYKIFSESPSIFQGLKNLSTKLLEKFRGMPEQITEQQFAEILNRTKKEGIKLADESLITKSLVKENGKINLAKTAMKVEEQLVPLTPTPVKSPRWSNIGEDFIGDGKYGEIVYQSPIKTSAGDVHFQWNSTREGKRGEAFPNYFSHIRYEDMADGKTRKILETQSDLFQKENFAREKDFKFGKQTLRTGTPEHIQVAREKIGEKAGQAVEKRTSDLQKLSTYESNDPLAQLRTFREEVKRAAKDGKDTILIPSGETAMKIEGLGVEKTWMIRGRDMHATVADLKIGREILREGSANDAWIITDVLGEGKFKAVPKSALKEFGAGGVEIKRTIKEAVESGLDETFDISGKADTSHFVYKLNEEAIPREARKMGLNVEGKVLVESSGKTRPLGEDKYTYIERSNKWLAPGEWWKIDIPKERGKMPVEAFTGLGVGAGIQGLLQKVIPSRTFTVENKQYEEPKNRNTISQRHNNPGNQVFVGQEGAMKGSKQIDHGKWTGQYYAKFKSVEEGFKSMENLIQTKIESLPETATVRDLIRVWATNASPKKIKQYADFVLEKTNSDINEILKNVDVRDLADAMARFEGFYN